MITEQQLVIRSNELEELLGDPSLKTVDARSQYEYERGHLKGAISLPVWLVTETGPRKIFEKLSALGINRSGRIVIYGDNSGRDAARVAWNFLYLGYRAISLLEVEPTHSWPTLTISDLVEDKKQGPSQNDTFTPNTKIAASHNLVREFAEESKPSAPVLVDARERVDFLEGHLLRAQNIPWNIVPKISSLRDLTQFSRIVEQRNIQRDKEIIIYDDSRGLFAALFFFAFQMIGFESVKLCSQSFRELKEALLPIESVEDANYRDLLAK